MRGGDDYHALMFLPDLCSAVISCDSETRLSLPCRLQDPSVKILDGSWYMPNSGTAQCLCFKSECLRSIL